MAEHMNTEQEVPSMAENAAQKRPGYKQLWEDVKKHKKLYFIVLPLAFLLAAIYTLSLPNYYTCKVMLAPELSSNNRSSLSSLASSFGLNINSAMNANDAIRPDLYPELINSVTFRASLFDIKVHRIKEDTLTTYYDYLLYGQKAPWWSNAKRAFFSLFTTKKESKDKKEVNTFKLTKKQSIIAKSIGKRVICDVDKKTLVISITVIDQDPLIAATIADSVQQKLQDFIIAYRTQKARIDVEHYRSLEAQSKERYEKTLARYSWFSDHNQKIFLERIRSEQTKIENELQIHQRAYMQMASQLQVAEAKLQEETPAFTTLQPATVPLQKAGPGRASKCLIFVFLAFIATTVFIIHKEGDLIPFIAGLTEDEE